MVGLGFDWKRAYENSYKIGYGLGTFLKMRVTVNYSWSSVAELQRGYITTITNKSIGCLLGTSYREQVQITRPSIQNHSISMQYVAQWNVFLFIMFLYICNYPLGPDSDN